VRDQAIEHGIGGGASGGGPAGRDGEAAEPVTEPIHQGPAGPGEPPRPRGWRGAVSEHLAYALVLAVGVIGIIRLVQYHWRQGAALLGAALLLAALFRALLPDRNAGLLAVRGRPVDVLSYVILGGCVLYVAGSLTGGPFG
jgi:hypothetical protein